MPIYVYETIPAAEFALRQFMTDAVFTHDPESGRRVRRVIHGGCLNSQGGDPAPERWCYRPGRRRRNLRPPEARNASRPAPDAPVADETAWPSPIEPPQ